MPNYVQPLRVIGHYPVRRYTEGNYTELNTIQNVYFLVRIEKDVLVGLGDQLD